MKIELNLNDAQCRAAFKAAPQTMTTILGQYLNRAAGVLAETARREESPKGASTELSNSVKPHQLAPLEYLVSAGVDYAPYVHAGRKPGHYPNMNEGSPFYEWVKSIAIGRRAARRKGGEKAVDDAVFMSGRAIRNRGIQPKPFMERAFTRERSHVEKLMREFEEAIR